MLVYLPCIIILINILTYPLPCIILPPFLFYLPVSINVIPIWSSCFYFWTWLFTINFPTIPYLIHSHFPIHPPNPTFMIFYYFIKNIFSLLHFFITFLYYFITFSYIQSLLLHPIITRFHFLNFHTISQTGRT